MATAKLITFTLKGNGHAFLGVIETQNIVYDKLSKK